MKGYLECVRAVGEGVDGNKAGLDLAVQVNAGIYEQRVVSLEQDGRSRSRRKKKDSATTLDQGLRENMRTFAATALWPFQMKKAEVTQKMSAEEQPWKDEDEQRPPPRPLRRKKSSSDLRDVFQHREKEVEGSEQKGDPNVPSGLTSHLGMQEKKTIHTSNR
ncbi:hypothetical protein PAXRUDRAFT_25265 [Paxillus rubicundulus Ve08.2h10]|uniref:Uncharacterized protein n=1 Tax=Paxillus rubicundulus Ve08.2h10 TaxID=930991 RepID=A0A0D0E9T6_9AGAM|nr:hypothetical protein PAXRUDRAFT_25265 [Paxillus rubicundulus Ve08.2h10]